VRVLLDENIPHDLIPEFPGHEVLTVQGLGWAGVTNGDLLTRARGRIDAFLTMDRKLERQHDLSMLPFGVVVVLARSNRVQDLLPLVPGMREALGRIGAGKIEHLGAAAPRRARLLRGEEMTAQRADLSRSRGRSGVRSFHFADFSMRRPAPLRRSRCS